VGRRELAVVAGIAATASIAALVLAETISSGPVPTGVVPALFIGFLVSVFALLAVAIIEVDRHVERLSELRQTSPRGSSRASRARLVQQLTGIARYALATSWRTARAVVAWLRRELEPERRRTTLARMKTGWYKALVLMGMPPNGHDVAPGLLSARLSAETSQQPGGLPPRIALEARRVGIGALATRRQIALARSRPPRSEEPTQSARPIRLTGRGPQVRRPST
jgi:hypothetical protein